MDDRLLPHVRRRIEEADMGYTTPCWVFTGPPRPDGYARVSIRNRMTYLHVYVYETLVGPKPPGLDLDHLCRIRHCCNPSHLDPTTRKTNVNRGETGLNMASKTECPAGHKYTEENTYHWRGKRMCRACRGYQGHVKNSEKTQCNYGHDFTPENTYTTKRGYRHCRACAKRRSNEFAQRRRDQS